MLNYYNEIDPFAAQWLRNLIDAELIPYGIVDTRSIRDVQPSDLAGFTQCHFFAGIGGWSYALSLAGVPASVPLWTGSCPCQPFSAAGKRGGFDDDRHLWPDWFRLIRQCRPAVIFGEQVASVGVIGKIQEVQSLRPGKTRERFQNAQQMWITREMSRLREHGSQTDEALAVEAQARLPTQSSTDTPRFCAGKRCETQSAREEHSVRSRLERHSTANRDGTMRSYRSTVQFIGAENLERSIARSDRAEHGLHAGKYPRRTICSEYDGEQLGDRSYLTDRRCYSDETLSERIERIISEDSRSTENKFSWPWIDTVRFDLVHAGYTIGACVLPACAVSAPHIRQRLWFVADTERDGREQRRLHARSGARSNRQTTDYDRDGSAALSLVNAESEQVGFPGRAREQGSVNPWQRLEWLPCIDGKWRPTQPGLFPLAYGVPARVGRLRAYGNAIVPALAAEFIKVAMECRS